jgi:hypothetical protein
MTKGLKSQSRRNLWPAINLDWRGLDRYWLLSRYVKSSDTKVAFERRTSKDLGREESSYKVAPLVNLEWKNGLSSTMTVTFAKSTTLESNQELWNQSWSASLDLRYTIEGSKGVGIPLPFLNRKKLSFKSTLTTNLGLSYGRTSTFNQPASGILSVSPNMSYRFSNNLTGALAFSYKRSSGGLLGQVRQSVQVAVSAEFKF